MKITNYLKVLFDRKNKQNDDRDVNYKIRSLQKGKTKKNKRTQTQRQRGDKRKRVNINTNVEGYPVFQ